MPIANKILNFVKHNKLKFISSSPVINQKLFRIESSFVENNPNKVRLLNSEYDKIDIDKEIKLFTNDKAGKNGRAKWFAVKKDTITTNIKLISEWQVIVSSANAGGQKRDNKIQIVDNHSAFGRSRIALKSFKTEIEAKNFLKYSTSNFIKFAFLLTDEQLSSLGQYVPDILNYQNTNPYFDFSEDIDKQFKKLLSLTDDEENYIKFRVKTIRNR